MKNGLSENKKHWFMMTHFTKRNIFFTTLIFCNSFLFGQEGYSSASLSMNRSIGILSSDEVVVEEYMNYHKHVIQMPKKNETLALDLRNANSFLPAGESGMIVQLGIATGFLTDFSKIPALNLTFVIDKSGSMGSDNKILKVKTALKELIKKLRKQDVLTIIVFDTRARILASSQDSNIDKIIDSVNAGGSTNMYEGLMLGYEQTLKNMDANKSNCVLLLTDGQTNQGVTDPSTIISNSKLYNDMGIELTTIGVGKDLNFDLLHKLANQGKGSMHFIDNCDDIQKVFVDEVESLLKPIARNVHLNIEIPSTLEVEKFYGYSPLFVNNKISLELNNFGSGLTQIVMFKLKQKHNLNNTEKATVKIALSYFDLNEKKYLTQKKQIEINSNNKKEDPEIKKNYAITFLAQSLKDMAFNYEKGNVKEANTAITDALSIVRKLYSTIDDRDIQRVITIAEGYENKLAQKN